MNIQRRPHHPSPKQGMPIPPLPEGEGHPGPFSVKKMVLIAVFALLLTLLIACGGTSNPQSNNPNTVTMGTSTFNAMTITIHKGNTLTFVNNADSASLHI